MSSTSVIGYRSLAHAALAATPVCELVASPLSAVVLERRAMGGGATDWYFCASSGDLDAIECLLSPGSLVSFYFDGRIRQAPFSPQVVSELTRLIQTTGEAILGVLRGDGRRIDVTIVVSLEDLAECVAELPPQSTLFVGTFPNRDNDGHRAVTVTLPDAHGVVRSHPH